MIYETTTTDILILGSGGAGLFAALHAFDARPALHVTVAVKGLLGKSGCTRMVQGGYNTTFDGQGNELYFVNGVPFAYMDRPIKVKKDQLVRIYLTNILEYDPINSFHLHGNFFDYYPTGTRLEPTEFTDTISQVQGQRGIMEWRFPYTGKYMFHAHKTEFAELGWMGVFDVR